MVSKIDPFMHVSALLVFDVNVFGTEKNTTQRNHNGNQLNVIRKYFKTIQMLE